MEKIIVHTDGGARGNPGPAAVGVVIKTETGKLLAAISRTIGKTTNNVAEYTAVIAALDWLKNNFSTIKPSAGGQPLTINFFLDSTLVVNQINGLFKVKKGHLRNLLWEVRVLEQEIKLPIRYSSTPREQNGEADSLVNKALDA